MISFRDWMERAVRAYYRSDFRRDFFTAPELDRAFGLAVGYQLAQLLRETEKPILLELGGGSGSLAHDVLSYFRDKEPELYMGLTYWIYEFSDELIRLQKERLSSFEGKVFWTRELFPMTGVVFSNEFFDCMPVHVLKGDKELFFDDGQEVWQEISKEELLQVLQRMGYDELDYIVEVCLDCIDFLKKLSQNLLAGYHLVIDYGYTSRELHRFPEGTVVSYRSHRLFQKPQEGMDITAHVNFSLLQEYGRDFGLESILFVRLREFLLTAPPFVEELQRLSSSELPEDIERLSRLKTMLLSMGDRFRVLIQKRLKNS